MRHAHVTPAGTIHIGLVANDLWWAEHDFPISSQRHMSENGMVGDAVARPAIEARRRPQPQRAPLPYDTFALSFGLFECPEQRRAQARRDAAALRERFGLSGLI